MISITIMQSCPYSHSNDIDNETDVQLYEERKFHCVSFKYFRRVGDNIDIIQLSLHDRLWVPPWS